MTLFPRRLANVSVKAAVLSGDSLVTVGGLENSRRLGYAFFFSFLFLIELLQ